MTLKEKIKHNNEVLLNRIKSEEPPFFKTVIKYALWLSGLAGSLLALFPTLSIETSPIVIKILEYCVIAGVVATSIAKLTTTNSELSKEGLY